MPIQSSNNSQTSHTSRNNAPPAPLTEENLRALNHNNRQFGLPGTNNLSRSNNSSNPPQFSAADAPQPAADQGSENMPAGSLANSKKANDRKRAAQEENRRATTKRSRPTAQNQNPDDASSSSSNNSNADRASDRALNTDIPHASPISSSHNSDNEKEDIDNNNNDDQSIESHESDGRGGRIRRRRHIPNHVGDVPPMPNSKIKMPEIDNDTREYMDELNKKSAKEAIDDIFNSDIGATEGQIDRLWSRLNTNAKQKLVDAVNGDPVSGFGNKTIDQLSPFEMQDFQDYLLKSIMTPEEENLEENMNSVRETMKTALDNNKTAANMKQIEATLRLLGGCNRWIDAAIQ